MSEHMTYLEDGWVLWSRGTGGTTDGLMVYAQLWAEKEGDRGEIFQLAVSGRNLTTDRLRSIPVAHIQTLANTSTEFSPHIENTPQNTMGEAFDKFRQESNRYIMAKALRKAHKPLTRPDGTNPDAFYRQVADAYRDVAPNNRKVAVVLAEEADVPVGTVHRWILEARRRGFLPSARQGRAG
jgi:hypothetical protein